MRIGLIGTAINPLQSSGPAPELAALFPAVKLIGYHPRVPVFSHTPLEQAMQALGHTEAALTAVDEGCAASAITVFARCSRFRPSGLATQGCWRLRRLDGGSGS